VPAAVYVRSSADGPLRQGEVLTGIVQSVLNVASVGTESPEIDEIEQPIAIIASQDCDLEQDFKGRAVGKPEQLPSVLFYEVIEAATLLSRLPGGEIRKPAAINKNERYQVLQAVPRELDALDQGLPDLGIDFKRYFTIPTGEVYKQLSTARRRCVLTSPYLEHFATRAATFQCRIALPEDHALSLPTKKTTR
jgi:hypothetical protein